MNYSFYVHDLYYEIGHSNVTIDMINNLPDKENHHYHFVIFTADHKKDLFPQIHEKVSYHFVPFPNIKPVFFKIIFYQFYSLFYSLLFDKKRKRISLGISNFNSHITIVHFIHEQWHKLYFQTVSLTPFKKFYKIIFFNYLNICEKIHYKKKNQIIITVADFLKEHLKEKYSIAENSIFSIHSGFDINRFSESGLEYNEVIETLKSDYPQLKSLNPELPICLFIGAFERKGLDILLKAWNDSTREEQLIIIGEGETSFSFKEKNLYHIKHTKKINLFYEASDYLFFPTQYEPFGMVLIEAAIKGLNILTNSENVGASEVLKDIPGITLCTQKNFRLPEKMIKLTYSQREKNIKFRQEKLAKYNWSEISKVYSYYFK